MPDRDEQQTTAAPHAHARRTRRRAARRARRWLSLALLLAACTAFAAALATGPRAATDDAPRASNTSDAAPRATSETATRTADENAAGENTTRATADDSQRATGESAPQATAARAAFVGLAAAQGADYSRFRHANPQHARLPCLLCHRREETVSARPRRPGHLPCTGCHQQQFQDQSHPVCAICHADARAGSLKPFPGLRSFGARFDHALHARGAARPRASCAACHAPSRGGVALSIPAGFSAHNVCYQCHAPRARAPEGGRDISSCGVCHQPGRLTRTPETAAAFRVGFSHARHAREGLSCAACHSVRAGAARGRQVTSPQPLQHHANPRAQSCMTCHDDRRAFGGDDFADCKRCHRGNTWHF